MLYNTQNPHGGDVYGAAVTLDFSSNVHPLGTPPAVAEAIRAAAAQVRQYPDPYCRALTVAIAAHEGVPQPYVLCGGGAAELIYAYCDALRPRLAAEFAPTFSEYRTAAAHFGAQLAQHPLRAPDFLPDEGLLAFLKERKPDVLFLCTPNNPTGVTLPRGLLEAALRICRAQGTRVLLDECFENSVCLSADVCNAFDPNYPDVSEKRNDARANCGFALVKYTGARGKSGTSDATAELMARIRCIFDKAGVIWQTGQLGKVDQGGGGTVAMYLANRNIDTVDAGVPVLSMHAPFECIAKLDLYMAYKGFGAFYRD